MRTISVGMVKAGALALGGIRQFTGSGAPSNGSSGTGAGYAGPSSIYIDKATNGAMWMNVGTQAAPVWSPITPVLAAVTSANILAMNATPVNLIVAPPAGYAVIVNNILTVMTRTATAYANGGAVSFVYTGGAVAVHASSMPAATVTTGGAGVALTQMGPAVATNGSVVPTATGVDITNATAAFITGTGTMRVFFNYSVIKQ